MEYDNFSKYNVGYPWLLFPKNCELLIDKKSQEGDLYWNFWRKCWLPIIIKDSTCHYIARPIKNNQIFIEDK